MALVNKKIYLPLSLIWIFLLGCSGGSGGNGIAVRGKSIYWTLPTSYTDSSPLNPSTDLREVEIYIKPPGSAFVESDSPIRTVPVIDSGSESLVTSYPLASLEPAIIKGQTYQVSLRVVTIYDIKSGFALPPAQFTY